LWSLSVFRNFHPIAALRHTRAGMSSLTQSFANQRSPRARIESLTPVVIRSHDGCQNRGELHVVSVTGGLLSLARPLDSGSRVKVMFLTQTGAVMAAAEMLKPVSWAEQPFRFISLGERDRRRLKATIQLFLRQHDTGDEWIDRLRAQPVQWNPRSGRMPKMILAVLTLAVFVCAVIYGIFLK